MRKNVRLTLIISGEIHDREKDFVIFLMTIYQIYFRGCQILVKLAPRLSQ